MSSDFFEIREEDLLGRLGVIRTKHGAVETPTLTPVINPVRNVLPPKKIADLGFELLMTNAYIIKRNYGELGPELGVHGILGVDKPVMTDSGAYQLMIYGAVEVSPREIVEYQVALGSDIGVILDIPTRYGLAKSVVKREVEETVKRAREAVEIERNGMLLVGPVQGGLYLDLVAWSAQELSKLPFDLYAVGGPTQIMEMYRFHELVKLVMTAKMNLPLGKPLHLFGAGHPIIIPLAVAMGVDTFDSASYAIYARDLRYMTPYGTERLNELEELPCTCPICSKFTAEELKEMPYQDKVEKLALHNLYVILQEVKRVRQAIREGRLWELLEMKAKAHPSLASALHQLRRYIAFIERHHPESTGRIVGLFFFDGASRWRPHTFRHLRRLKERYAPRPKPVLLLVEETEEKPFTRFGWVSYLARKVYEDPELSAKVHVAVLSSAYSVIPIDLDGYYPLSQYETSQRVMIEAWSEISSDVCWYALNKGCYRVVALVYRGLGKRQVTELKQKLEIAGLRFFSIKVVYDDRGLNKALEFLKLAASFA